LEVAPGRLASLAGRLSDPSLAAPPPEGFRHAAVLVPLRLAGAELRVVLGQRTEEVPHHKGQICFPGGSREADDRSLVETALREAEEEMGIPPSAVRLLGAMAPVETVTGFWIRPFVGEIPADLPFVLAPFELDEAFEEPLSTFADPSRYRAAPCLFRGLPHEVLFVDVGRRTVWGATARILHDLAALALEAGAFDAP
jgi:8-oxo-dGTP pyrophosphatase MutT (NUDIX family)